MMEILTKHQIQELMTGRGNTCLSLYMPTHRSHPENAKDPILFKNLLKQLQTSLLQQHSQAETDDLLQPFEQLTGNADFWNHTGQGLAVLSSGKIFKTIRLQAPTKALTVAADSFHIKPLLHVLRSLDRFQVLGLSRHDLKIFEGDNCSVTEVKTLPGLPTTIEEALGSELTDKHSTVASYGGVGGESNTMHHGHGGKGDELDVDAERFFRVVAKKVEEEYSRPSGLPLVLVALAEHHALFQKVSDNPLLMPQGIHVNYKAASPGELASLAWEVIKPEYERKISILTNQFSQAKAAGTGSDDLVVVAKAAAEGRIEILLLEANRVIAGNITNRVTGSVDVGNLSNPQTDDLLDDIGELVTEKGGQVVVLPFESMPTKTGLAAIFRY